MSIKLFSKLVILSIFFVAVLGELKATKEEKLSREEIENQLDKFVESIGKEFVNSSVNCNMRNKPISELYYQLQDKFSHYKFQVKSLNDSITKWYKNKELHEPLFIKTLDPTGNNQEELTELITDFFVDEYYISIGDLPVNLLENVGAITKAKYIEKIVTKYIGLCPDFQLFTFNNVPITSSLSQVLKTIKLPETAIFLFHYSIPLDKYRTIMSKSESIKSSDTLIFHPLTPMKNLEYLKKQWKESKEDRPRFYDNDVNINIDNSFFEYLINPNSHVIDYEKMIFLNQDTGCDETFYYSKDISYLIHTIKSFCTCLVEHYKPTTSYYLSLNIYVQNEIVYATLRQFYQEHYIILYYSKTYTHDRPFERLVQEEVKYGRFECSNIVSYISIFSSSVFSVSFEIISAFCVEILLVVIFIKCLIYSWKKKEENKEKEEDDEEEENGKERNSNKYYNSNIKKLGRIRRYSGQIIYPKSPRARAPKVRSLSIGVTPIQPKGTTARRRGRGAGKKQSQEDAGRPSISSEMSDSRSLDLDE